jgi:hypothetical protein
MDIKTELDYMHTLSKDNLIALSKENDKKIDYSIDNMIIICNHRFMIDNYETIQVNKKINRCYKW